MLEHICSGKIILFTAESCLIKPEIKKKTNMCSVLCTNMLYTLICTHMDRKEVETHINTLTHWSIVLDDRQIYECVCLFVCVFVWSIAISDPPLGSHSCDTHIECEVTAFCFRELFFLSVVLLQSLLSMQFWSAATHFCQNIIIHYTLRHSPIILPFCKKQTNKQ